MTSWARLARIAIVLVLIAIATAVGWTWRHPKTFDDYPMGLQQDMRLGKVGEPFYFSLTQGWDDRPTVTLHDARPEITVNTAAAEVRVVACRIKTTSNSLIGSAGEATASETCDIQPIHDATLNAKADHLTQLLLEVTPHRPGRVEVRSVDLNYSEGWRSGHQRTGDRVTLRAR
ncbi:hypothetical protein [Nocardioides jiangxiensis]|uniref:Uncharacterized protein n=1 Tax=Nocardioides jiangxiensis TaxID=3064524 RepID=A0ABT9B7J1_9ACTN|nr:hypothetical protein [Nocardioides sp. WY-20]MDO7869552.1 hypothetical protein [Nocardioides sp. WY-20]